MSRNKFYLGDCLEVMKKIPDKKIDCIICDLPYGTTACKWDAVIPFEPLWKEYKRIIKEDGAIILFGSEPFSSKLRCSNLEMYKYDWVWIKNRATGHVHSKNKPMKKHENISVFSKGVTIHKNQTNNRMKYFPQDLIKVEGKRRKRNDKGDDSTMSLRNSFHETVIEYENFPCDILNFSIEMGNKRFHPTQKPVDLLEYLVKTYTLENDIVLDNCMGSGSTGVACMNTNRKFIGIEKEEKYFNIAKKRIEEAERRTEERC